MLKKYMKLGTMILSVFLIMSVSSVALAGSRGMARIERGHEEVDTLHKFNRLEIGGRVLSENDLSEIRGGFAAMAFGVYFEGYWNNLGSSGGALTYNGVVSSGEIDPSLPQLTTDDAQVRLTAVVGGFEGARGIFQLSQISGDLNVVHNNLIVQIALISIGTGEPLPSFSTLFNW